MKALVNLSVSLRKNRHGEPNTGNRSIEAGQADVERAMISVHIESAYDVDIHLSNTHQHCVIKVFRSKFFSHNPGVFLPLRIIIYGYDVWHSTRNKCFEIRGIVYCHKSIKKICVVPHLPNLQRKSTILTFVRKHRKRKLLGTCSYF